jgi:heptosyltransferase III
MTEFRDVGKILVIKLRHIGDVLLTVPVFRALRETFPNAHVSALVNSGTEEVLTGNPLIDEVITFDRNVKTGSFPAKCSSEISFLLQIRAKGFDMTVDLTSGDRAAVFSFVSGARYRLAYHPEGGGFPGKRFLYTHLANKDGSLHMALQNLDVVRQFGIATRDHSVGFFIPPDAEEYVDKIFADHSICDSDTIIHIHPTSRWLFKCWKDEFMAEVINWLICNNARIIVTSSPYEEEMKKTEKILDLLHDRTKVVDLCGKTTLKQLAAVSAKASLFFGVDSAPMHIAAAAGTPVFALFGPSGAAQWGPWCDDKLVFVKNLGCVTCEKCARDGIETRRCLEAITPAEVISAMRRKLYV